MSLVQVRILGPLEVDVAARRLELGRKKEQALLALLALRAGEAVGVEELVDGLWGEAPPKAVRSSLQNLVFGLRRRLGADLLVRRSPGYALEVEPGAVDAHRFEQLVRESRGSTAHAERVAVLREALGLWRGPPLANVALEPFALLALPRLEEHRLLAWGELIDAELERGHHAEILREISTLVDQYPYDERLRAQLMVALYRSGRQADALDVYRRTRDLLVDELGIEPSARLREVELAILRHDPTLAARAPLSRKLPVRRTVTVLFADLVDSTALVERLDPEALRRLYDRVFGEMRDALERHGGTVEKFIGDAVLALFGVPVAHEDDAHRALRAAVEIRDRLASIRDELRQERALELHVRIGVNTGEVFVDDPAANDLVATGAAVNVAKRLEEAAAADEVVIGPTTFRLARAAVAVEPLEPLMLREGTAVGAWRLTGFAADAGAIPRRLTAPLIGRADELAQLCSAFERVRDQQRSELVVVAGEPGIGKTRLVRELAATVEPEATVVTGQCVSYGEGVTWLPLSAIVGQLGGAAAPLIGEPEADAVGRRVEELLGLRAGEGSEDDGFWAVRRLLEAAAARSPLVAVFEDVHWAEPTLLDLIEYLGRRPAGGPLLLVAVTRAELLRSRRGLSDHAFVLRRLPDREARALMDSLKTDLPGEMLDKVMEVAGGNPLFVEQLVAHAREEQELALRRLEAVPPSVEALLASRIDLLTPDERAVLRRAAVVGTGFSRPALISLLADEAPEAPQPLGDTLRALEGKEFIRSDVPGEAFAFQHVLIRDVAYAEIPKAVRAELHEQLGEWLERRGEAPEGELDEIVGYHLEQASQYRRELMPRDERAVAVGRRAASLLASAARRAPARGDWPAAGALLSRAVALLRDDDPQRIQLLPQLARAIGRTGDYRRELALLDEAMERADAAADRPTQSYALLFRGHAQMHVDPSYTAVQAAAEARDALHVFESVGDEHGQARAWARIAYAEWFSGRHQEARRAEERTLAYAVASGDHALEAEAHGFIGGTLLDGPEPLDDLLSYADGLRDRPGAARLLTLVARARAMRGDFETARKLVADDIGGFEDVGNEYAAARAAAEGLGAIDILAGDPAAAEVYLRSSLRALEQAGETGHLSTVAAQLANAVYHQGRWDEAERFSRVSEEAAAGDDYRSQVLWRLARARVLARRGIVADGERVAREAVEIVGATDDVNLRGDACHALAEVLQLADRPDEAASAMREAVGLYERKGNAVAAARARHRLAGLQPARL